LGVTVHTFNSQFACLDTRLEYLEAPSQVLFKSNLFNIRRMLELIIEKGVRITVTHRRSVSDSQSQAQIIPSS
jgi:hypothetical protein